MKINAYQLQQEIFTKVAGGLTKSELWDDLRQRKEELRHLCDGGNPSHDQYRQELSTVAASIRERVSQAAELGPFAQADLRLQFKAIDLAGRVCADVMELSPDTITDIEDIRDSYQRLSQSVTQNGLRDCDLVLDGKYTEEIDTIYGKPEVKGADDAEDLT